MAHEIEENDSLNFQLPGIPEGGAPAMEKLNKYIMRKTHGLYKMKYYTQSNSVELGRNFSPYIDSFIPLSAMRRRWPGEEAHNMAMITKILNTAFPVANGQDFVRPATMKKFRELNRKHDNFQLSIYGAMYGTLALSTGLYYRDPILNRMKSVRFKLSRRLKLSKIVKGAEEAEQRRLLLRAERIQRPPRLEGIELRPINANRVPDTVNNTVQGRSAMGHGPQASRKQRHAWAQFEEQLVAQQADRMQRQLAPVEDEDILVDDPRVAGQVYDMLHVGAPPNYRRLKRFLEANGCVMTREGANHTIMTRILHEGEDDELELHTALPRHDPEYGRGLVRAILWQVGFLDR